MTSFQLLPILKNKQRKKECLTSLQMVKFTFVMLFTDVLAVAKKFNLITQ